MRQAVAHKLGGRQRSGPVRWSIPFCELRFIGVTAFDRMRQSRFRGCLNDVGAASSQRCGLLLRPDR
jgi:hypothetical protein